MAEQLAAIEALPEQFGGIATGFRHATIGLARESAKWIRLSILPTNTFFQGSTLETRLYITRTNNKLLFGFIRRPGETAVIMIEHDMDTALDLAESVTLLNYGRVIVDGDRDAVIADERTREVYLGA